MEQLPEEYEYVSAGPTTFLTQLKTEDEVCEWLEKLQAKSKETWRIKKTFRMTSKAPRNIFKRIYRCHFNVKQRSNTGGTRKKSSRNVDCPAQLIITIKRILKHSKAKKQQVTNNEWPCTIKFVESHNHRLTVVEALRLRPISVEVRKEIENLFDRGHSPATAFHTFCSIKREELGDYYDLAVMDRHHFPTKKDFSNIWQAQFKNRYGERHGEQMLEALDQLLRDSHKVKYKIVRSADEYAVALTTPFMERCHDIPQCQEIMFVDASGNCDTQDHKVYFFVTQSAAGGVPIGCIISSSQKSVIFDKAVEALIEIFDNKILPASIMTDDDLSERRVLQKYWPRSTLFLCTFHVLKAAWKWISLVKNKIPKEKTQSYYSLFSRVLYSNSVEELEKNKIILLNKCEHENFKKYANNMFLREKDWCNAFRQTQLLRGTDTNNFSEVIFRLFKDIPLERTKAFNLTQLCDFIITGFDQYFSQRILDRSSIQTNQ